MEKLACTLRVSWQPRSEVLPGGQKVRAQQARSPRRMPPTRGEISTIPRDGAAAGGGGAFPPVAAAPAEERDKEPVLGYSRPRLIRIRIFR